MIVLIIAYVCLGLVEHYFFGMQRVLLEAGRIIEKDISFLLPGWYIVHHVPIVFKYAVVIWICAINFWIGLLVFGVGFIVFNFILPIPRKIYHKIFNRQMVRNGLDGGAIVEISFALRGIGSG
jgi:hypothetical protein